MKSVGSADKKSVVSADKKSVVSADTTDFLSANTTDFSLQTQQFFCGWQGVEVGIWVLTNMPPEAKPTSVWAQFHDASGPFFGSVWTKGAIKKYLGWRARPGLAGHPKNGSQNREIVIEIGRGGVLWGIF